MPDARWNNKVVDSRMCSCGWSCIIRVVMASVGFRDVRDLVFGSMSHGVRLFVPTPVCLLQDQTVQLYIGSYNHFCLDLHPSHHSLPASTHPQHCSIDFAGRCLIAFHPSSKRVSDLAMLHLHVAGTLTGCERYAFHCPSIAQEVTSERRENQDNMSIFRCQL